MIVIGVFLLQSALSNLKFVLDHILKLLIVYSSLIFFLYCTLYFKKRNARGDNFISFQKDYLMVTAL